MRVSADLCIIPMGVTASVSDYVVACQVVLETFDLVVEMHANGTNLEGELSEITRAVEACYERLFAMGVPRALSTLVFGARIDKPQTMQDKVDAVRRKRGIES